MSLPNALNINNNIPTVIYDYFHYCQQLKNFNVIPLKDGNLPMAGNSIFSILDRPIEEHCICHGGCNEI